MTGAPTQLAETYQDGDLASQQLLRELAQAVAGTMVPTKGQGRHHKGSSLPLAQTNMPLNGNKRKRKSATISNEQSTAEVGNGQSLSEDDSMPNKITNQGSDSSPSSENRSSFNTENGISADSAPSSIKQTKSHKRFVESEDEDMTMAPVEQNAKVLPNLNPTESNMEQDSEDEAPEAVTAATAFETSRATIVKAAKLLDSQASTLRQKRREHNERLKKQAERATSRRPKSTSQGIPQPVRHQGPKASASKANLDPLPELLPDSILSAAPPLVLPPSSSHIPANESKSRSTSQGTGSSSHKKLFLPIESSHQPKDVRRDGTTKIRVLPTQHAFLPPRATEARTRSLREAWLMGRHRSGSRKGMGGRGKSAGLMKGTGTERQKWNKGTFVVQKKA